MMSLAKLLRPEQWTKNVFVFLPVFFNGQMLNMKALVPCVIVFISFSLAASSIYCFNDIFDLETDKLHPEKCKRPIASGLVSREAAYVIMVICLGLSVTVLFLTNNYTLIWLILFYVIMNIAYCVRLKQYPIIDVVIISVGFVLRVLIGGIAADIWLSEWIVIMTFLLALFLAFAKRRDDVILYQNTGILHRGNTIRYNLELMNQVMTVVSTIIIVAYIMYTLSPDTIERFHGKHIYFTAIFVLMGIIRYLQITIVDQKSSNPTRILLYDRFIQCCIIGWVGLFTAFVYF